jgi:CRISPR-associated protein Cas2
MPGIEYDFSEYKSVWLFTLFDLPVESKLDRRNYSRFRNLLLDNGFTQMQYSVYARFCASDEIAETYRQRITGALPPDGYVRLLAVTDRQFARMQNFYGKRRAAIEAAPDQLMLF